VHTYHNKHINIGQIDTHNKHINIGQIDTHNKHINIGQIDTHDKHIHDAYFPGLVQTLPHKWAG
jgi:hypothetical protein